jgi:ankyrin repeat protein
MSDRIFSLVLIVFLLALCPACSRTSTNSASTMKASSSPTANSPLMVAVKGGQTDAVKSLLSGKDVDVNITDTEGNTPLIEAARFGHDDIARTLIAHGADLQAKNKDGDSALMLAVKNEHQDMVKVLTEAGAK